MPSITDLRELRFTLAEVRDSYVKKLNAGEFSGAELPFAKGVLGYITDQLDRADQVMGDAQ